MNTTSEYVTGMQAQLKAWDANVAVLLTESRKADGEARTAYAKRLKELRLSRKARRNRSKRCAPRPAQPPRRRRPRCRRPGTRCRNPWRRCRRNSGHDSRCASATTRASARAGGTAAGRASANPQETAP